jgi:hypothetical protein
MRPTGRSTGRGACRPSCVSATASTCRASASSAVCEGPSSRACRTKAWAHDDPGARRSRRRRPRQAPVPSRCTGRPLGRRHHLPAHLAGVGSISLPSKTPTAGGSLAGAWPITCAQSSSSRAADGLAPPPTGPWSGPSFPSRAASSCHWPSARKPATPASPSRWAAAATASTTPSPRASSPPSKKELVHRQSWPTRRELTSEVFEYVEAFYNTTRRHLTLGYLSPTQFEAMTMTNNPKEIASRRKPRRVRRIGSTPQA